MEWYYAENGSSIGPNSLDAMKHHLKNGRIGPDTMIWTSAFGSAWKSLKEVGEFAGLFAPAVAAPPPPPPVSAPQTPPTPPAASNAPFMEETRPAAANPPPPSTPVPPQQFREELSVAPSSARDAVPTAGPWSRYFARQIDLTLWAVVSVGALAFALIIFAPQLFYSLTEANSAAIGMLGVALAMLVNGIVVGIFGNSIGKAIFGIRVYRVGSDKKLPFLTSLKRELKVWVFGLGIGFPLATLVTVIIQFRKVSSGKPAGYDKGEFLVQQKAGSGRITLGIIISLLLIGAAGALNAWGSIPTQHTMVSWNNPDSGKSTTLSSAWQYDRQTVEGATSSTFINTDIGEQILIGVESFPNGSLGQYTLALGQSLSADATLSGWENVSANTSTATGKLREGGYPMDLYVFKVGNRYWRIISFDITGRRTGHFIDRTTMNALITSMN